MSIVSYNDIHDYWQTEMFRGHQDFKETMSRDYFMRIRSNVVFLHEHSVIHDLVSKYPLWYCRKMLQIFQKNCVQFAVPLVTSSINENTARTKERTRANSYIPSKRDPYGIMFYAVLVWNPGTYLFSFSDNRSGNITGVSPDEAYCHVFPEMRTPYNKFLKHPKVIDPQTPTALWILQMSHQINTFPTTKIVFLMDNFYIRQSMAALLKEITDGEDRIIGTVKFTNVDSTNRLFLSQDML